MTGGYDLTNTMVQGLSQQRVYRLVLVMPELMVDAQNAFCFNW